MNFKTPIIRIIDDDPALLRSQTLLLETLGWTVKAYNSALDFLEKDDLDTPGCLILDVRMPGMTGLELQNELSKMSIKNIYIIFTSAHGDIAMAVHAVQEGALDFLEKPVEPTILIQKVNKAITLCLQGMVADQQSEDISYKVNRLTFRERDVSNLIAQGLRNKEIARVLGIEESTVKMHRANALAKLGVSNAAELTRLFTILEFQQQNKK